MKQQVMTQAPLGVSGHLDTPKREIRVSLNSHLPTQESGQHAGMALHHQLICAANRGQCAGFRNTQHEGVIEAARSLNHRAATAATSKYGNSAVSAPVPIDLMCDCGPDTDYDEGSRGLPESQALILVAGFGFQKKRLVQGQEISSTIGR